ncbi:MAG TPA: MOSC domain-containing protein [Holophagaceae bacterium]|nr:MOSC domain-containing protein [Holophagaceae bacterium]
MIQLLEVRMGRVQERPDAQGRPLRSAIHKESVPGPVLLGSEGLLGDEVGDRKHHGGPDQALLAYARETYDLWAAEGRPLAPGAFGENLLLSGLDDHAACIGDRLRIGEALLQVSQPRVPCGTLQRHLGWPDTVARVYATGRGGFYLRVLVAAPLQPGVPVELLDRPQPAWSVARALHARWRAAEDPAECRAMGSLPELSADWRARFGPQG